jgi:hypothetical protein
MLISRRGLIGSLASLLAAPAIVRASSLMPVKAWTLDGPLTAYEAAYRRALFWDSFDSPSALSATEPYPGWRFRFDPSGIVFHEPDPDAANAA